MKDIDRPPARQRAPVLSVSAWWVRVGAAADTGVSQDGGKI